MDLTTFLAANAELASILNTAKVKRKVVRNQKKRIRAHMEEQQLEEYTAGEYTFTLKNEDTFRFSKKAFLDWLDSLPGEEPDEILSLLEDFESDTTEARQVFKCKRRKPNDTPQSSTPA